MPLLYLHAQGAVLKAKGVDGLSRETARARRASESLPALLRVVMAEATCRLGSPISLDLFTTADNTLVPASSRVTRSRSRKAQMPWHDAFFFAHEI